MTKYWDVTVSSKHKLFDLKLPELVHYRDLIAMFFVRDFTSIYKQTILGPLWHIINPLCSTVVYAFIFGNLARMGTGNIPYLLFYYGGTMLWTFFSNCLNGAAGIFLNNAGVFSKVYFPRLTVALSIIFSAVAKMLIQFAILLIFFVYYAVKGNSINPSWHVLLFPLLVVWLAMLGAGCGMIFSALTTKYRDLNHLLGLVIQLAMYVTPVVYPLSQVPEKFFFFFYINPVSAPMEIFRIWFYGSGSLPYQMILSSIGITALIMLLGLGLFTRTERNFVDVI
ncbi:MAG: ABC transporter permease [Treponema sp.]|jgi:lipopolysaccharide transport system permease protein|nr:ABC transporter permease [Treponema sp.]